MAIPDHVRMAAMDAVSHYETTARIRAYEDSGIPVSPEQQFSYYQPPQPENRPIPAHVREQAMDAVSHPETQAQIRLVRDNGEVTAPWTPSFQSQQIADKIARLQLEGRDVEAMNKDITKDHFGREYG